MSSLIRGINEVVNKVVGNKLTSKAVKLYFIVTELKGNRGKTGNFVLKLVLNSLDIFFL